MEQQNFNVTEAADYLNVSRTTLYELIKAKHSVIPTFFIGTKMMISRLTLDDFNHFQYMEGGCEVADD